MQVVAFVKGTRTAPQCGFSYKVLDILNQVLCGETFMNCLMGIMLPVSATRFARLVNGFDRSQELVG